MNHTSELIVNIETSIPSSIVVGRGNALYLAGWCAHAYGKISKLEILIAGNKQRASMLTSSRSINSNLSQTSNEIINNVTGNNFWVVVPIAQCNGEQITDVKLIATLNNKNQIVRKLADIHLVPESRSTMMEFEIELSSSKDKPLVAIAMATHNPQIHLFRRQIQSLIAQNHINWVCIISDDRSDDRLLAEMTKIIEADKRFILSSSEQRLGFYHNFERSLSMIPKSADYIALSDQDDYWYPDKLQTMLAHFSAKTLLAYSDMRVITDNGEIISSTFWPVRSNNSSDIAVQLLINSVTGAASIFVSHLLDYILPFPPKIGELHHDHWIGCVAMAVSEPSWINHPLHDYIQHGHNVTGFDKSPRRPVIRTIYENLKALTRREGMSLAKEIYFNHVLKTQLLALVLRYRCASIMSKHKLDIVYRMALIGSSAYSVLWLGFRSLISRQTAERANGAEYHVLMGVGWRLYAGIQSFVATGRYRKLVLLLFPKLLREI